MAHYTIETAPPSPYNHDWCDGCGGVGSYRRVTYVDAESVTRWVAWLCDDCAASGDRLLVAYAWRSRDTEDYATDERWVKALAS